jgi:hypothetical protein
VTSFASYLERIAPARRDGDPGSAALFEVGLRLAPAFAAFAMFVREHVTRAGITRAFFLSREGPLLEGVFHALPAPPGQGPPIATRVLEVSGVSTFLPSLQTFAPPELMRMWSRFPRQTPGAFLASLQLAAADFADLLARHELDPQRPVVDPWRDARVCAFVADPAFLALAGARRDAARARLVGYLEDVQLAGCDHAAVVDIGWRGTIQDSLALVLPRTHLLGLYLALRPQTTPRPLGVEKHGFVADVAAYGSSGQEIRACAGVLEMLTHAPGGSTVDYRRDGDRHVAVRRIHAGEEPILRDEVPAVHAGVLAGIPIATAWFAESGLDAAARRAIALTALKSVLFAPADVTTALHDRFCHDQTWGLGGAATARSVRFADVLLAPVSRRHWLALRDSVQGHGWPHALVRDTIGARGFELVSALARRTPRARRWVFDP